jgi:hypothetical protein
VGQREAQIGAALRDEREMGWAGGNGFHDGKFLTTDYADRHG